MKEKGKYLSLLWYGKNTRIQKVIRGQKLWFNSAYYALFGGRIPMQEYQTAAVVQWSERLYLVAFSSYNEFI